MGFRIAVRSSGRLRFHFWCRVEVRDSEIRRPSLQRL
jgi:hypothetical protein